MNIEAIDNIINEFIKSNQNIILETIIELSEKFDISAPRMIELVDGILEKNNKVSLKKYHIGII